MRIPILSSTLMIFFKRDFIFDSNFVFRFVVKLWQAASVHGHKIASQTGCKLIAYTQIGMTHVISYLLVALAFYAYKVTMCFLPLKLLKHNHIEELLHYLLQNTKSR